MSVKAELNNSDMNMELLAPETILKTDDDSAESKQQQEKEETVDPEDSPLKEDELMSLETLRESPVQWPERFPGMDDFLTMSDTPMYSPIAETQSILTAEDMVKINRLSKMTPEELIAKIKRMHDEIYQLGLMEAKEMTRGKLLEIFDRNPKRYT
ncbi:protein lin-52 homolog [Drosophila madeirensis]|uniref:Protein lin-52 homolog n=1 Tax=Drosophila madeirensis TaxID=30013 RepID=A0AAU9G384_DROMD|nr:protein lin-52 homolog [Drosophila subobscura]